jgi:hypothetical protein
MPPKKSNKKNDDLLTEEELENLFDLNDNNQDEEDDEDIFIEEDNLDDEDDFVEESPKKKPINIKRAPKEQFYVDPKEFDKKIIEYYETGVISDEVAEMISKISNKLSYSPNFQNYSYRMEFVGDAIVKMMKALINKKYDHKKGVNPFSYFTRIAFHAFVTRIKIEKKASQTLERYQEEFMVHSANYNSMVKNNNISKMKDYFHHNE